MRALWIEFKEHLFSYFGALTLIAALAAGTLGSLAIAYGMQPAAWIAAALGIPALVLASEVASGFDVPPHFSRRGFATVIWGFGMTVFALTAYVVVPVLFRFAVESPLTLSLVG